MKTIANPYSGCMIKDIKIQDEMKVVGIILFSSLHTFHSTFGRELFSLKYTGYCLQRVKNSTGNCLAMKINDKNTSDRNLLVVTELILSDTQCIL